MDEPGNLVSRTLPETVWPPIGIFRIIPVWETDEPAAARAQRYAGRKRTGVCPSRSIARGREPRTSPKPPVLAKGTASEAAKRICIVRKIRIKSFRCVGRGLRKSQSGFCVLAMINETTSAQPHKANTKTRGRRRKESANAIYKEGRKAGTGGRIENEASEA